jgi:hypothetical protein
MTTTNGTSIGLGRAVERAFEPGGGTRARHDALDLLLPRASDQQRAWAEVAAGHCPQGADLLSVVRTVVPADARLTAGAS